MKKSEFVYYSTWPSAKPKLKSSFSVNYNVNSEIEDDEYTRLRMCFFNYLDNILSDDIIELVTGLKEIFKDYEDDYIYILIQDKKYRQEAEYKSGKLHSSRFEYKDMGYSVSISDNALDLKMEKNSTNDNDINLLSNMASSFLKKRDKLYELESASQKQKGMLPSNFYNKGEK